MAGFLDEVPVALDNLIRVRESYTTSKIDAETSQVLKRLLAWFLFQFPQEFQMSVGQCGGMLLNVSRQYRIPGK